MRELGQTIGEATPPQSYLKLLDAFNERCRQKGELLTFNIENKAFTVYNPAPVVMNGQTSLWARVEERITEKDSKAGRILIKNPFGREGINSFKTFS